MDKHAEVEAAFNLGVGEAVRAWSALEGTMWHLVADLLGVDQFRARIVMSSFTSGRAQRILLLRLAETYLPADVLPPLRKIMEEVAQLSKDRNAIAHDPFSVGADGILWVPDNFGKSKQGAFETKFEEFPLARIHHLRDRANRLRFELIQFLATAMKGQVSGLPGAWLQSSDPEMQSSQAP